MNTQSPRVLLELAVESLLRDKALVTEALGYLPRELFPPVFMKAFTKRRTDVVKAMVQSWPFLSLPLGSLMSMDRPGKRMLQAVLRGLDVLLKQKVCSRKLKLQVLDMWAVHQYFWRVWPENKLEDYTIKWSRTEKTGPRVPNKRILKIIVDLWIDFEPVDQLMSFLLQWVQEKEGLVQLDCPSVHISVTDVDITGILQMLNLEHVHEVDVDLGWKIFAFAQFAPFLGQMKNLCKLTFCGIDLPASMSSEKRQKLVTEITSELLKLHFLREVFIDHVNFIEDHLDQVLRCLTSPLEALSVTDCLLSPSDWNLLSCSEQIRQLEYLNLSCTRLTSFSLEPLQHLLSNVSATLTILNLENCGITDEQVCAFLPSLSSCSQLITFCFIRNFMSMCTMKNLLCHTARLRKLTLEMYSLPQDVYVIRNDAHPSISIKIQEKELWNTGQRQGPLEPEQTEPGSVAAICHQARGPVAFWVMCKLGGEDRTPESPSSYAEIIKYTTPLPEAEVENVPAVPVE
ncbi:PRAME family member 20-like [Octodon degus]|uniref:PRAME family member 20-like n=1 Tax=Octodon degus TaxID=10160 RepID=A0A6P6ESX5_OCTDE|nr:PRAME family member 20-like [Octodon degus]